jgi:hypothetical protein
MYVDMLNYRTAALKIFLANKGYNLHDLWCRKR